MYTSTLEKIQCKIWFTWVTRGTGASSSVVSSSSVFASSLRFFFLNFFGFVSFVTTTPDKFKFRSQIRLSQINVMVPIRLKFKRYANFIEWGSRIDFLFMGWQDIVNYWDFPYKISRNCHKSLEPKITRHDKWEMIVKMSLCGRLICFADFVGRTLLIFRFLLPLPNCFLKVCLLTLFAAVLIFFLPLTTSAISGTANYSKSAPTHFAAGTTFLRKKGISVLPITCASASKHRPRCRPTPL